jgi:hypothetical protein
VRRRARITKKGYREIPKPKSQIPNPKAKR